MKDTNIGVYQIRSLSTNKFYIGSSSNLKKREFNHFRSLRKETHHNALLQKLFIKNGEDDFQFIVLKFFSKKSLARELEDRLINKYWDNPRCLNIGHNAIGGDNLSKNPNKKDIVKRITKSVRQRMASMTKEERIARFSQPGCLNGMYGKTHTKETRKKLSEANKGHHRNKGIHRSEETKYLLSSIAHKRCLSPDYVNPFKGKTHTPETRAKLRAAAKKRAASGFIPGNARKVKVGKKIYSTVAAVARVIGKSSALVIYRINSPKYPDYEYVD